MTTDGKVLKVVEDNVYELFERYESMGECDFCGADLTEADRMDTAAKAHKGSCPIGRIRRALLWREKTA